MIAHSPVPSMPRDTTHTQNLDVARNGSGPPLGSTPLQSNPAQYNRRSLSTKTIGKRTIHDTASTKEATPGNKKARSQNTDIISLSMDDREERILNRYETFAKAEEHARPRALISLASDIPYAKPQNVHSWMTKAVASIYLLKPEELVRPLESVLSDVRSVPERADAAVHMQALLPIVDTVPYKHLGRVLSLFIPQITKCPESVATNLLDESALRVRRLSGKEKADSLAQIALNLYAYSSKQRLEKMNELGTEIAGLPQKYRKQPLRALVDKVFDLPPNVRSQALTQCLDMIESLPKHDQPALLGQAGLVVRSLPKQDQEVQVQRIRTMASSFPPSRITDLIDAIGLN